ncbi:MAG: tetratricopeptide repeat protein [Anaerolineae bacterium]|nr:tetratricopeptide repeat protein [Anaerolineae bacterium]
MTRPQPRYQPGDRIGGRYQVHKALLGGMGEVYLCLDLEENYPYALKTFQQRYQSSALRKAFEQEVITWVALEKHPNIVRCFYMDILDNQPFMVLEWIAGQEGKGTNLRGWLRHGPLDLKMALEMTIDVVRGLVHAQEKQPGLVHRDLKPENILVAQGGLAKITDFGLAQIVQSARLEVAEAETKGRQSLVQKRGIAGTAAYLAPEQWQGEQLDERTDIYAVGCILYELLTGRWPNFISTAPQKKQKWLSTMQTQHETKRLDSIPLSIPERVWKLLYHCLANKPADRPNRLSHLLSQLEILYEQQFDQPAPARAHTTSFSSIDYNNRGYTYNNLKLYEQALVDFTRAIDLDPKNTLAYTNRSAAHIDLKQPHQALADLAWAIDLDPEFAGAYVNRGLTCRQLQQPQEALADFTRAIDLAPEFALAYNNRGLTYRELQQPQRALVDYNRAIDLDPEYAAAYSNRGLAYHDLQQSQQALADLTRAIELDPDFAQAYYNRGTIYRDLQETQQALTDLTQAIDLIPELVQAYHNRGLTYHDLQQPQQALADYNWAIDLDPEHALAYVGRGIIYYELKQPQHSLADLTRAIELDPKYAKAYNNRGNTYIDLQQPQQALVDYNRAIELDSEFAQAYANRGATYIDLEQPQQALADLTRAIELDPKFAQAYFNLGILLAKTGQLGKSLSYFEQATRLGFLQANQAIAQVRKMLGKADPEPQPDPTLAAFEAFQQAASPEAMRQAVARYPFIAQPDFIAAVEQVIAQQVPPEQQPYFEQRLGWLRQMMKH